MYENIIEINEKEVIEPAFDINNVPVCFFSDNNYVPYLGTAVYSAIKNMKETTNLDIIIFYNGYSNENKYRLTRLTQDRKNVSIRFLNMSGFIAQLKINPSKRVSINCMAKIFCTDDIFSKYEKVIVLDSDLLVLQDLMELYQIPLNNYMIGAVKEIYVKVMAKNRYHTDERLNYILLADYLNDIGLDCDDYFNTGVIVFDVRKCQKNNIQKRIIEINQKYPTLMYAAQDDLNILFKKQWLQLDDKWNIQNPYSLMTHIKEFPEGYRDNMENAGILHFLGKSKPWNDKKVWESTLFDKYAMNTEWADEYKERRKCYEKKHYFELYIIPKGSLRRLVYLKCCYFIRSFANKMNVNLARR